eukprot:CAMPEP_0198227968 /NCGR_PEP_ID=MMETSP1445-20131203/111377_1 /TAXON_ID=36898 /ORGANISM="Pyramimonas sp., Strain CCMP2087" /LENGTH=81 /DNA_ID=CAMNT_0043908181 /DNA_START=14 /DNA_END=259 /DNA_ORIENTATION=+
MSGRDALSLNAAQRRKQLPTLDRGILATAPLLKAADGTRENFLPRVLLSPMETDTVGITANGSAIAYNARSLQQLGKRIDR